MSPSDKKSVWSLWYSDGRKGLWVSCKMTLYCLHQILRLSVLHLSGKPFNMYLVSWNQFIMFCFYRVSYSTGRVIYLIVRVSYPAYEYLNRLLEPVVSRIGANVLTNAVKLPTNAIGIVYTITHASF